MAKSRKKKNAHKDFQKVKLKVGKGLKKADNVTNPSFHTRTIQVTQKIKNATTTEPTSRRKLNVNELLSQFQHYSISTRHDAVTGLRELLSSYPEIIVPNLLTIVEKTTQLFVDKDPVVRQAVIKVLRVIFPAVSEKHVAPFLHMISAHLCCAMTHIYEDIQADSLQILDLMLDHFPALVVSNSSQILPNFIEQISRAKLDTKQASTGLAVNPNLKMASHKWRAKVLARLHKLLSAILGLHQKPEKETGGIEWQENTETWQKSELLHVQTFPNFIINRWKEPGFTLRSKVTKTTGGMSLTEESGVRKFVQLIVPLLMECWIEANTISNYSKGSGSLLTADSLPLRLSVIRVIQLLCQYVLQTFPGERDWLKQTYFTEFKNQLLKFFPYSVHVPAKKHNKGDSQPLQESVTNLNLGICDIMTHLLTTDTNDNKWEVTLLQFLEDIVGHSDLDKQQMKIVIDILKRLVDEDVFLNVDRMMEVLIQRYKASHPLSSDRKLLLGFFSQVIFDRNHQTKLGADVIDTFLTSLPDLFMEISESNQQMAAQVLKVMKMAACQNCWILLQQLNKFVCKTVENEKLFISLDLKMQKRLIELVYYTPDLPESTMKTLLNLVLKLQCPVESCLYLIQTLHHRYSSLDRSVQRTTEYISFMLSVIIRCTEDDVEIQQSQELPVNVDDSFFRGSVKWERTLKITEAVCIHLRQYGDTEQMVQIIVNFLHRQKYTECQVTSLLALSNHMEFYKYPMTDSVTERLVHDYWTFCCHVTVVQNSLSDTEQFESLCFRVLEKLTDYVMKLKNARSLLVSVVNQNLEDNRNQVTEIKKTCQAGSPWLRHYDSWLQRSNDLVENNHVISDLIPGLQESCPELRGLQWWSDFNFMITRLKL